MFGYSGSGEKPSEEKASFASLLFRYARKSSAPSRLPEPERIAAGYRTRSDKLPSGAGAITFTRCVVAASVA